MVAEKAADIILGKEPLPASNAPYYLDEDWETRQRTGEPARAV
jgi:choline dehydrogenase